MSDGYLTSASILGADEFITELGGSAHEIARDAGINPDAFSDPNDTIPGNAFADFLELAAQRCDCPDFGARYATRWTIVAIGHLSLTISSAETVGDAIRNFIANFQALGNAASLTAEDVDGDMLVRFQTMARGRWGVGQWVEANFAFQCSVVRANAAPGWTPVFVRTRHAPSRTELISQMFGPHLSTYQSEDSLLIGRDALTLPLKTRGKYSPMSAAFTPSYPVSKSPVSIRHQAEVILQELLPRAEPSLGAVASALGISRRTLQRRLADAGTNFNTVLDDARSKLAWRYVTQSPLRFHAVAEIIGFKEQTAFSHAFRRWYGVAPREARRAANGRTPEDA